MVHVSFAGHTLQPLPEGALYWPAESTLLVADLHFEKASFFASRGQMLPPYDSIETISLLERVIERVGAKKIVCLGDSFHDGKAPERLSPVAAARLRQLTASTVWIWITGNHDSAVADGFGGRIAIGHEVGGLRLRHEADPSGTEPEISGHYHPKISIRARGRSIARRCFVISERRLILPAFGAFTGGLDVADPAILAAAGRPATALVATPGKLLRFPLAA